MADDQLFMKPRYEEKPDALYLRLDDSKFVESEAVRLGGVLDCSAANERVEDFEAALEPFRRISGDMDWSEAGA